MPLIEGCTFFIISKKRYLKISIMTTSIYQQNFHFQSNFSLFIEFQFQGFFYLSQFFKLTSKSSSIEFLVCVTLVSMKFSIEHQILSFQHFFYFPSKFQSNIKFSIEHQIFSLHEIFTFHQFFNRISNFQFPSYFQLNIKFLASIKFSIEHQIFNQTSNFQFPSNFYFPSFSIHQFSIE